MHTRQESVVSDGYDTIYNGADEYLAYSMGWALFDKNDPTKR